MSTFPAPFPCFQAELAPLAQRKPRLGTVPLQLQVTRGLGTQTGRLQCVAHQVSLAEALALPCTEGVSLLSAPASNIPAAPFRMPILGPPPATAFGAFEGHTLVGEPQCAGALPGRDVLPRLSLWPGQGPAQTRVRDLGH